MTKLTIELPTGKFHTIAGVQKATGRCRNTVRKMIAEKKLDARNFAGLIVVSDASLNEYCGNLPPAVLGRRVGA